MAIRRFVAKPVVNAARMASPSESWRHGHDTLLPQDIRSWLNRGYGHWCPWTPYDASLVEQMPWADMKHIQPGVVVVGPGSYGVNVMAWGEPGEDLWSIMHSPSKEKKLTSVQQAVERYTESIRGFHHVKQISLVQDSEGATIWTFISATPFDDDPRERIISVQLDVMRATEKPLLGFQLINLQELGRNAITDDVAPTKSVVLWKA